MFGKYPEDVLKYAYGICEANDTEWRIIHRLLLAPKPGGRPRSTDLQTVVNAMEIVKRSRILVEALDRGREFLHAERAAPSRTSRLA